jgi:hypothetical protein
MAKEKINIRKLDTEEIARRMVLLGEELRDKRAFIPEEVLIIWISNRAKVSQKAAKEMLHAEKEVFDLFAKKLIDKLAAERV